MTKKEDLVFAQLSGSEKQVAFAEKIRKELIDSFLETYNEDYIDFDNDENNEYVLKDKKAIDILCSSDSAEIIARYTQNNF